MGMMNDRMGLNIYTYPSLLDLDVIETPLPRGAAFEVFSAYKQQRFISANDLLIFDTFLRGLPLQLGEGTAPNLDVKVFISYEATDEGDGRRSVSDE